MDVAVISSNILVVALGEDGLCRAPTITPPPTTWDALALLLLAMGLWGFNWIAAALGVALGLWRRGGRLAAIVAPLALLALLAGTLIVSFASSPGRTAGVLVAELPAWLSYPAAFGLMRLAERRARPDGIGLG